MLTFIPINCKDDSYDLKKLIAVSWIQRFVGQCKGICRTLCMNMKKNYICGIHGENFDCDVWAVTLYSVVPVGSYFCCRGICCHKIVDNLLPDYAMLTQKTINPNEKISCCYLFLKVFMFWSVGPWDNVLPVLRIWTWKLVTVICMTVFAQFCLIPTASPSRRCIRSEWFCSMCQSTKNPIVHVSLCLHKEHGIFSNSIRF